MREHYITATLDLLEAGHPVGEVFAGLRRVLGSRNHAQLLPGILRGILRRLSDRTVTAGTRVFVATIEDAATLAKEIELYLATLGGSGNAPVVVVDGTLIGGAVVEHNAARIDASYKRALLSLYERVTE